MLAGARGRRRLERIVSPRDAAMAQARAEGIVLTPQGEPLFARDLPRWREILATPAARTAAEAAEDAAAERE